MKRANTSRFVDKIFKFLSGIFNPPVEHDTVTQITENVFVRTEFRPTSLLPEGFGHQRRFLVGWIQLEKIGPGVILKLKDSFYILTNKGELQELFFKKGLRKAVIFQNKRPLKIRKLIIDYGKEEKFKEYL